LVPASYQIHRRAFTAFGIVGGNADLKAEFVAPDHAATAKFSPEPRERRNLPEVIRDTVKHFILENTCIHGNFCC